MGSTKINEPEEHPESRLRSYRAVAGLAQDWQQHRKWKEQMKKKSLVT